MTTPERASLEALRAEVNAGFTEMRTLMETRRIEEVRVQEQLDRRIAVVEANSRTNKVLIRLGGWLVATVLALSAIVLSHFGGTA